MRKVIRSNTQNRVVNSSRGSSLDTSKFRFNQTPVESLNGVTVTFTLPNSEAYQTGLLEVYLNGNQCVKDVEWQEDGGTNTTITLIGSLATTPPTSGERLRLTYIKQ